MYRTKDPATVLSPKDCIQSVEVIFDGKDNPTYSVAIVEWQGIKKIGVRWNINQREWSDQSKQNGKECLGEPNSRGYATWFMLPEGLVDSLIKNDELGEKIKVALEELRSNRDENTL